MYNLLQHYRHIMLQLLEYLCPGVETAGARQALAYEQNGIPLPAPALMSCQCHRRSHAQSQKLFVTHLTLRPFPAAVRRAQTRTMCATCGVPYCTRGAPWQLVRPQAAWLDMPLSRPTQLGGAPPLAELCRRSLHLVLRPGQASSSRLRCLLNR